MKKYKVEGNKCFIYINDRLFDIYVFRSKEEAEEFKIKELEKEARWMMPY